jgi:hypothetical protein
MKQRGTKQKKAPKNITSNKAKQHERNGKRSEKRVKRRIKEKSQEEKKTGCTRREKPKSLNPK